jgi:hypothetical protein
LIQSNVEDTGSLDDRYHEGLLELAARTDQKVDQLIEMMSR